MTRWGSLLGTSRPGRIQVRVPVGLDGAHARYVLESTLGWMGLEFEFVGPCRSGDRVELAWPNVAGTAGVSVAADDVRNAFERLSGRREKGCPRDSLGRVSASEFAEEASRPVLSEWAWRLAEDLAKHSPGWRPPSRRLRVHLTHDVDRVVGLEPMGLAGRMARCARGLLRARLQPMREVLQWLYHSSDLLKTYESVMRMEAEAGAVATYFFLSGPYSFRRFGSRSGRSGRWRRLIEMTKHYEHRVGLHGCAYSLEQNDYARQREALCEAAGQEITWHRNHYLVWDAQCSPSALEQAGIRVDSTVGWHDANGFRAGLAWPYRLWNFCTNRPSDVWEIPLVFMDATCNMSSEKPWSALYKQLYCVSNLGGSVAILFHVDHFIGYPDRLGRYEQLLSWLNAHTAEGIGRKDHQLPQEGLGA